MTEPREPSPENRKRICKIRRSKEVLEADFPQSKVVFNLETYIPFILNHTGVAIWNFLSRPKDMQEIVAFLQKRYRISVATAKKDAQKFIRELKKRGFIKVE